MATIKFWVMKVMERDTRLIKSAGEKRYICNMGRISQIWGDTCRVCRCRIARQNFFLTTGVKEEMKKDGGIFSVLRRNFENLTSNDHLIKWNMKLPTE